MCVGVVSGTCAYAYARIHCMCTALTHMESGRSVVSINSIAVVSSIFINSIAVVSSISINSIAVVSSIFINSIAVVSSIFINSIAVAGLWGAVRGASFPLRV